MSQASSKSSMLLLQTKLAHPQLPLALVPRERLLRDLDAVSAHRLTLLSASAGSGKTTLLSTWAIHMRSSARKVAWLSLDEWDNDPIRFWASVIAALRTYLPAVGEDALHMLSTPQPAPIQAILTTLINEILEQGSEITLVLDDYQMIEDQAIHEALTFLLDHLPVNLHLVLASRIDPDLPLSRWRMRGQMLEIRDPDLCFTQEEATSFLVQAPGFPFSVEEVNLLQDRTQGWIAGLQLATLALRRREDRATFLQTFTGGHRYLMDYIQQEVLKQQPLPLQQFLLQVAVLPRMNADLCLAVTDEPRSQEFLEVLERNNLFLIPLDEERRWYRLHDLFREVLLARLQATQHELLPVLHLRAARWYEEHDALREAIAHALQAGDFVYAALLMERAAEHMWQSGEVKTMHSWIKMLPEAVLRVHARIALTTMLNLLRSTQYSPEKQRTKVMAQVDEIIVRVEQASQCKDHATLPEQDATWLTQHIRLLRLISAIQPAFLAGDAEQLERIALEILALIGKEEADWKVFATYSLMVSYEIQGKLASLLPYLEQETQEYDLSRNYHMAFTARGRLAGAYLSTGLLRQARKTYLEMLDLFASRPNIALEEAAVGYVYLGLAMLSYEWNQLEEVDAWYQKLLPLAQVSQNMHLRIRETSNRVHFATRMGDIPKAEAALKEFESLVQDHRYATYRSTIISQRIEIWLAQGNLAEASNWAADTDLNFQELAVTRELEYVALARVYRAQRKYTEAWHLLERMRTRTESDQRGSDLISILALQVVVLQEWGETEQARKLALRLLTETAQEGYVRVYLEAGEPMKQVLQSCLDAPQDEEQSRFAASRTYVSTLLAAFEQEQPRAQRRDAFPVPPQQILAQVPYNTSADAAAALIEPLSPQERRVLRLLVAGRSNPEIASALVVSVNTVKTHLQSMYRKMGVTNRVEASAAARSLHLL
ncbi:hypothetical protein KSD_16130 [Ktedonobacter sp. SOSP1-85]|uniref:LuxR C-terminal-related transcriptional regulator n=1 Tax=Ktedonobacter sp. SOSP1-85 TaxID=2778367 RepID=UPI0019154120|nr:LuxR C-terminal-related transcriptional regulator [Ktedonobacter sp. SOSP1-85]GHO73842.1 hypothetical protein KSD_16130 [Ktedonobacter sp. SOSP1-85]